METDLENGLGKLFVIMAFLGLVAIMLTSKRLDQSRNVNAGVAAEAALQPDDIIGGSNLPGADPGPTYLVGALPIVRRWDDTMPIVSQDASIFGSGDVPVWQRGDLAK